MSSTGQKRLAARQVGSILLPWIAWMSAVPFVARQVDRRQDAHPLVIAIIFWVGGTALAVVATAATSFVSAAKGRKLPQQAGPTTSGVVIALAVSALLIFVSLGLRFLPLLPVAWIFGILALLSLIGVGSWIGQESPVTTATIVTGVVAFLWSGLNLWSYVAARTSGCWDCEGTESGFAFAIVFILSGVVSLFLASASWVVCGFVIKLRREPTDATH